MRRKRYEQAFGPLTTCTLDALRDPFWMHSSAMAREPVTNARTMAVGSARHFVVRSSDCFHDGSDQVVCFIEVGSCSLQEEQML